jgi:hypothetical protein
VEESGRNGELKKRAQNEKMMLKTIFSETRTISTVMDEDVATRLPARKRPVSSKTEPLFLLSTQFLEQWRDWIKNPLTRERPDYVDDACLVCEHDKLLVDLNELRGVGVLCQQPKLWMWENTAEEASPDRLFLHPQLPLMSNLKLHAAPYSRFTFVTKDEWRYLDNFYGMRIREVRINFL